MIKKKADSDYKRIKKWLMSKKGKKSLQTAYERSQKSVELHAESSKINWRMLYEPYK